MTDTLWTALQTVAALLGVKQSDAAKVYRTLMREGVLPKSRGRHVEKATPESVAQLLLAVVVGVVERDGELRAAHVPDAKAKTLQAVVRGNVAKGAAVLTDEDRSFVGLGDDYLHLSVNHSKGEYVRLGGFVHTNSIESVWALLKRQIIGIHHWVSPKHLSRYVDEMAWRFNRREMDVTNRMNGLFACVEGRLRYRELIA